MALNKRPYGNEHRGYGIIYKIDISRFYGSISEKFYFLEALPCNTLKPQKPWQFHSNLNF